MTKLKRLVITRPTSQERNDMARKVMGPTTALLYNIINTATFRVPLSIVVKESPRAKPLLWQAVLLPVGMKTDIHKFAIRLALI